MYPELERAEGKLPDDLFATQKENETEIIEPLKVDADDDRKPRSLDDMEKEATWLKSFFIDATKGEVTGNSN